MVQVKVLMVAVVDVVLELACCIAQCSKPVKAKKKDRTPGPGAPASL